MNMSNIELLKQYMTIADLHTKRASEALTVLAPYLPLTEKAYNNLTIQEIGCLEIITTRFGKLQDLLGSKIFSFILFFTNEKRENLSYIDGLNLLEKLEFLPSTQKWLNFRDIRNDIAHEYPFDDESMVKKANTAIDLARILIDYWKTLRPKIEHIIAQYEALQK